MVLLQNSSSWELLCDLAKPLILQRINLAIRRAPAGWASPDDLGIVTETISNDERLEGIAKRELNLPRVRDCSRGAVQRIGRAFAIGEWTTRASCGSRIERAEIGRAVYGVEEPDVDGVQEVEGLGNELNFLILVDIETAREAEVQGLQSVTPECVSRFDAHTVVVPEDVAVGVETGELGEILR